ncbi:MAG: glycosyltransferase family 2 protein [Verrucomicrobiaceae bacterium]|nr:glycosyltransferase family 2 protein [Verrucomicrobiaceae bacterium]
MKQSPAISVLMPVRNARETVTAAIESVVVQSFTDWELVVVDDGSQDGTTELLRQIVADETRMVLIEQEPKGIAEALNRGLASCRSEFVARMDADDVMSERRLEIQSKFLAANRDFGLV